MQCKVRSTIAWKAINAVILSLAFASTSAIAYGSSADAACDAKSMPGQIGKEVGERFSSWKIKASADFSADHASMWAKAKGAHCPGIISGQFTRSDKVEYVLLLVPKAPRDDRYRVVLFTNSGKAGSYSMKTVLEAKDPAVERVAIGVIPAGRHLVSGSTHGVALKYQGIQVEALETGAIVYFWKGGHFQSYIASE